jgi:hypothetical protein
MTDIEFVSNGRKRVHSMLKSRITIKLRITGEDYDSHTDSQGAHSSWRNAP